MQTNPEALAGLAAAINKAGSAKKLADSLGMVRSAIGNWRRREGGIPAQHVPEVSRFTGLPPHVLRPDLFDVWPRAASAPVAHAADTTEPVS